MHLTESFKGQIPLLQRIIDDCGLHACDGPVPIQNALDKFKVKVKRQALPVKKLFGISIADVTRPGKFSMVINTRHSAEYQRKTMAHEFYHLIAHEHGVPHHSWDGELIRPEELEADWGAAYLLVPLGHMIECMTYEWTSEQIAFDLMVPHHLVQLRFKMALALDEIQICVE